MIDAITNLDDKYDWLLIAIDNITRNPKCYIPYQNL